MGIEAVFPRVLFTVGSVPVKDSVFFTWLIIAAIGVACALGYRRYRVASPRTWQLAIETIVDYVETTIQNTVGHTLPATVPYLTSMIVYIAMANLLGMVPLMRSPTRDINTTAALSIVSLCSTQYFGARQRGLRRQALSFFEPALPMLPLNVMGMLSRSVSMALRLFGNVLAGEIVGVTMSSLVPLIAPLPMSLLSMITGVLQALVFTTLTIVFVADAMKIED